MSRVWVVASVLMASGCGRTGFDKFGTTGDGGGDGVDDYYVDDDALPAVSCATLAPICGPAGTSPCCESPVVTGGMFLRSYDGVGHTNTSYPARIGTFRLDKYEVTVGRFREFVTAGQGTQQNPPDAGTGSRTLNDMTDQGGWDSAWNASLPLESTAQLASLNCGPIYPTWTDAPGANENRPINCIDWYQAMAFCIWDGGFLPTEAEWNYAASGGSEQRVYPWSSPPSSLVIDDSSYASYWVDATKQCMGDGVAGCQLTDAVPVGTKPAGDGRWGQSDLAGNLFEWALDWYDPAYSLPCTDCANLTATADRVVRGGAADYEALYLRTAFRIFAPPATRRVDGGFRCARR